MSKRGAFSDLWTYLAIRVAARTIPYEGVCDVSPPPTLSFSSRASLVDILPLTGPVTLRSITAAGCEKYPKNATHIHTYTPQSRLTRKRERRVPLRCGWKVNTFTCQGATKAAEEWTLRFLRTIDLPAARWRLDVFCPEDWCKTEVNSQRWKMYFHSVLSKSRM